MKAILILVLSVAACLEGYTCAEAGWLQIRDDLKRMYDFQQKLCAISQCQSEETGVMGQEEAPTITDQCCWSYLMQYARPCLNGLERFDVRHHKPAATEAAKSLLQPTLLLIVFG